MFNFSFIYNKQERSYNACYRSIEAHDYGSIALRERAYFWAWDWNVYDEPKHKLDIMLAGMSIRGGVLRKWFK